jgi:hypothetical protein
MLTQVFLLVCLTAVASAQRRDVKTFTIDLDKAPEDRFTEVSSDPIFNATLWEYYNTNIAPNPDLQKVLYGISAKRGDENEEMMGELAGIVGATNLPFEFVKSIQMLQELTSIIMVPIVNFSSVAPPRLPEGYEPLEKLFPTKRGHGFGCTGIIARNSADGTVSHARNLDLSPTDTFSNLVYNGVFTRGGVEIFRSQLMVGYTMVITGIKGLGETDGFAIERNTRFIEHKGGAEETLAQLTSGVDLNGWTLRKVFEEESAFDSAVSRISTTPFASTEYVIVSGVQEGTILSKSCQGLAHRITLGSGPSDYIIMTNFDYYWNDVREFFDPTAGGGFGRPTRRGEATKLLDAAVAAGQPLTPDTLFGIINAPYVLADTIFQVVMSVEGGLWNTSIPVPFGG